jgi:hypothetical protein
LSQSASRRATAKCGGNGRWLHEKEICREQSPRGEASTTAEEVAVKGCTSFVGFIIACLTVEIEAFTLTDMIVDKHTFFVWQPFEAPAQQKRYILAYAQALLRSALRSGIYDISLDCDLSKIAHSQLHPL